MTFLGIIYFSSCWWKVKCFTVHKTFLELRSQTVFLNRRRQKGTRDGHLSLRCYSIDNNCSIIIKICCLFVLIIERHRNTLQKQGEKQGAWLTSNILKAMEILKKKKTKRTKILLCNPSPEALTSQIVLKFLFQTRCALMLSAEQLQDRFLL